MNFPDELSGFEEAWNGNARKHLPGLSGNFIGHDSIGKIFLLFNLDMLLSLHGTFCITCYREEQGCASSIYLCNWSKPRFLLTVCFWYKLLHKTRSTLSEYMSIVDVLGYYGAGRG